MAPDVHRPQLLRFSRCVCREVGGAVYESLSALQNTTDQCVHCNVGDPDFVGPTLDPSTRDFDLVVRTRKPPMCARSPLRTVMTHLRTSSRDMASTSAKISCIAHASSAPRQTVAHMRPNDEKVSSQGALAGNSAPSSSLLPLII